jgi:hypothetical protein
MRLRLPGSLVSLCGGMRLGYPSTLPEPLGPADLAGAMWDLYLKRDRFEDVIGDAMT